MTVRGRAALRNACFGLALVVAAAGAIHTAVVNTGRLPIGVPIPGWPGVRPGPRLGPLPIYATISSLLLLAAWVLHRRHKSPGRVPDHVHEVKKR